MVRLVPWLVVIGISYNLGLGIRQSLAPYATTNSYGMQDVDRVLEEIKEGACDVSSDHRVMIMHGCANRKIKVGYTQSQLWTDVRELLLCNSARSVREGILEAGEEHTHGIGSP